MPHVLLVEGNKDVVALNKGWFADEDWSLKYNIVKKESTSDMGYALAKVDYHDLDPDGNAYNKVYYLTLLFKKLGDS